MGGRWKEIGRERMFCVIVNVTNIIYLYVYIGILCIHELSIYIIKLIYILFVLQCKFLVCLCMCVKKFKAFIGESRDE